MPCRRECRLFSSYQINHQANYWQREKFWRKGNKHFWQWVSCFCRCSFHAFIVINISRQCLSYALFGNCLNAARFFFCRLDFSVWFFFLHSLLTYVHASSFISTTLIRLSRLMCLSKKKQCTFWAFTAWAIWSTTKFKPGNIRWYLLCTGILYRTNWNLFAFVLRSKYNNKQTKFLNVKPKWQSIWRKAEVTMYEIEFTTAAMISYRNTCICNAIHTCRYLIPIENRMEIPWIPYLGFGFCKCHRMNQNARI